MGSHFRDALQTDHIFKKLKELVLDIKLSFNFS